MVSLEPKHEQTLKRFLTEFRCKGHRQPTPKTLHLYGHAVTLYLRWLGNRSPSLDSHGEYINEVLKSKSAATALLYHNAVRAFHRWLNVPAGDVYIASPVPRLNYLGDREIERLVGGCRSAEERAIFIVAYESGLRASELLGIEWQSIDWSGGFIRIRRKGGKDADVPLFERSIMALRALQKERGPAGQTGRVFMMNYNHLHWLVSHVGQRVGIKVAPHALRHARASYFRRNGAPLDRIQELLGHANPTTTYRYYAALTPHELREDLLEVTKKRRSV